jgi:hypothetical protein
MVDWILNTSLNAWIMNTVWAWPLCETLHFFGLSMLMGSLLIIDLRLLGFFRNISMQATHQLLPWVFVGFGINLTTGLLFLVGDPERYIVHTGFRLKMLLVIVAGLNALWFFLRINQPMRAWASHADTPLEAKLIGGFSLICWFAVLILGRLIPYTSTG